MFELPISKSRFKRIIFFIKLALKLSHFCKKMQNFRTRPQTPVPLEEQNQVLLSFLQISQKQSSTPNAAYTTKRSKSIKYFLVGLKPENQVCLSMFLNIFSISHKKVKVICNNKVYRAGMIIGDQRGKHGQQRKVFREALNCIKKHIESFPACRSHYSRKDTDIFVSITWFI